MSSLEYIYTNTYRERNVAGHPWLVWLPMKNLMLFFDKTLKKKRARNIHYGLLENSDAIGVCWALHLGKGQLGRYLSIESILMKYHDDILEPPFRLPAYIMEGKLKILGRNHKFEEIISLYPIFLCILKTFIQYCSSDYYVEQICHVFVTILFYNLNLACQVI